MEGTLEACIGRILAGEVTDAAAPQAADRATAGTGFLVSDSHMLTCAHVVAQALGIDATCEEAQARGRRLAVEIHTNIGRKERRTGEVVAWRAMARGGANHSVEDIAVLKLDRPSAVPCSVIFNTHEPGVSAKVYGFGERAEWVTCRIAGNGQHWTELDCERREILLGYSGAPVFNEKHTHIFGMVVARENASKAHMIRVALLREVMRAASCGGVGEDDTLAAHKRVVIERLRRPNARPFLDSLQKSLKREFRDGAERHHFSEADRIGEWAPNCTPAQVGTLFGLILDSMQEVRESSGDAQRSAAADAAIALFTLVACALVDRAGLQASSVRGHTVRLQRSDGVERSAGVVYAVVAAALFGGVIELKNEDNAPVAPNVLKVMLPLVAERPIESLERHIYAKLLERATRIQTAQSVSAADGPLSKSDREDMLRLLALYGREKVKFTFVVGNRHYENAAVDISSDKLPMVIDQDDPVSMLLGMSSEELAARFNEMWTAAQWLRSGARS